MDGYISRFYKHTRHFGSIFFYGHRDCLCVWICAERLYGLAYDGELIRYRSFCRQAVTTAKLNTAGSYPGHKTAGYHHAVNQEFNAGRAEPGLYPDGLCE